jgi:hypothetical protein
MWGEGASDLWGHLEGEDAASLKAIRKRLLGQISPALDQEANADITRLDAAHSLKSDDPPRLAIKSFLNRTNLS